jgi:hypothetical protein
MSRIALILLILVSWLFSSAVTFAHNFGNSAVWVEDVADGGSFTDPVSGTSWNLDGGTSGYLFTAVAANRDSVYTGRSWYGPWSGSNGGTIQRWDASTGELLASVPTVSSYGAYSIELKDDGTGTIMLYVYKMDGVEIYNRLTLAYVGGSSTPDPGTPLSPNDPRVALKRLVNRSDGVNVMVQHYYGGIGTFSSPGTGQSGQQNVLGLYQDNPSPTVTGEYDDPSWVTDIVPPPTTLSNFYFGVEAVALSTAGDYMYVAGGNKAGGIPSSRLEKIELDMPPSPVATVSATPGTVYYGGNVTISWTSSYADYCSINSTPSVLSTGVISANGYKTNVGPITSATTFTATCARDYDGASGTNQTMVTVQPPVAVSSVTAPPMYSTPATNLAVTSTTNVNFDGTGSTDQSGGSALAYEWREGSCTSGTLLSSAGTFAQTFSSGAHSIYLRVKDTNTNAYSTNCPLTTVSVPPQCSDGIDNDADGYIDSVDPGCWTNPADPTTYDPNDNTETNCGNNICEKTYGESFKTCPIDCRIQYKEN